MSDLFTNEVTLIPSELGYIDDFLKVDAKAKSLLPQINWIITQRKIEYTKDLLELRKHKSIQIRRKIAQGLAFLARSEDINLLQMWQLAEADRQTWLILEGVIDKIKRGSAGENLEQHVRIFSVTEALVLIKKIVGQQEYTLEGELVEVRVVRQMYYFGLKDSQESRLDCWAFAGIIARAGFPLNDGLSVRVQGSFKLSKSSRIYFDIQKITLTGEGELLRNLKLLEEKLSQEGLFDQTRKRALPRIPKRILLLASPSSAALSDFTKVLASRRKGLEIYFLPIKTQGVGVEFEILEQLSQVNNIVQTYSIDTLVMTRGGGSSDDLSVFNSEKVVRAIYSLNIPTIVAIGHERDTTLAELVADKRASTPSQAAEIVSISSQEILQETRTCINSIKNSIHTKKNQYILTMSQLKNLIEQTITQEIQKTRLLSQKTTYIVSGFIQLIKTKSQKSWQSSLIQARLEVDKYRQYTNQFDQSTVQLKYQIQYFELQTRQTWSEIVKIVKQNLESTTQNLNNHYNQLAIYDPQIVLKKGYVLVLQNNEIVDTKSKLQKSKITLRFADGYVDI